MGKTVLPFLRTRYMLTSLLPFLPTIHSDCVDDAAMWQVQRDMTQELHDLERVSFPLLSRIFFVPLHQLVTLDDYLMGTRARDNQVKTLSARKSYKEVHIAELVSDAIFSTAMEVRFRKRG